MREIKVSYAAVLFLGLSLLVFGADKRPVNTDKTGRS